MEYHRMENIVYTEVPVGEKYEYYVPRVQTGETGSVSKRRPGKEPTLPDSVLSPDELDRRNNRRRRNREAASRVRERRIGKMAHLEKQVDELKSEHKVLEDENDALRRELIKLRRQTAPNHARPVHRMTRQISNTEAPKPEEMPIVPKIEPDVFQSVNSEHKQSANILFTPGGTFVLTPIRQDIRFDFPEPQRMRSVSDGEYKKILLNL